MINHDFLSQHFAADESQTAWSPEQNLCAEVLLSAFADVAKENHKEAALSWANALDDKAPFAFIDVCQALNLDANAVRKKLIENRSEVISKAAGKRCISAERLAKYVARNAERDKWIVAAFYDPANRDIGVHKIAVMLKVSNKTITEVLSRAVPSDELRARHQRIKQSRSRQRRNRNGLASGRRGRR